MRPPPLSAGDSAGGPRPALVTGASSGIGRALVEELTGRGYDVVACADEPAVQRLPEEVDRAVTPVQVDLATPEGVDAVMTVLRALPPVRFAAFNAAVATGGAFLDADLDEQLRLVDLNVRSVVHLAHHVLRDMVSGGGGHALVTSSIAADAPGPYFATYAASKAFAHSFAAALGHELRGSGVTVTSVQPGPTDTHIFARGGMLATRIGQGRKDDPRDVARDAVVATLAGRAKVVPGSWTSLAQSLAGRVVPERVGTLVAAYQTKPRR